MGCVSVSPKAYLSVCIKVVMPLACWFGGEFIALLLVSSRVQEFRNSTSVLLIYLEKKISIKKGTRVCRISEFLNGSLLVPLVLPRSAVLHIKSIS